jgi:DNA-directed RNA polymerase subunit RPC12/RpoP
MCPGCGSRTVVGQGRVLGSSTGIWSDYLCSRCGKTFVVVATKPLTSPEQESAANMSDTTITFPWHSTRATDRAVYHDNTRCPEGDAVGLKYRRPGDGGRDPCEHCAQLLIRSIEARLLRPRGD